MCYWLRRLGIYIGLSNYCIWENTASDIVIQIASYYTKNVMETDKGEREREREREKEINQLTLYLNLTLPPLPDFYVAVVVSWGTAV